MTEIDLTGEVAEAVNGAVLRGPALVLGYVADDGSPSLSYRGSAQVYSTDQLAVWARKPVEGLAQAITARPTVSLLYYSRNTPGPAYLSIKGRARVAPEVNDAVYDAMVDVEQAQDSERKGVAILIDVDDVIGLGAGGMFHQERSK
jgi:pyridoxamine 5'-phosphate oxidase-like protein